MGGAAGVGEEGGGVDDVVVALTAGTPVGGSPEGTPVGTSPDVTSVGADPEYTVLPAGGA